MGTKFETTYLQCERIYLTCDRGQFLYPAQAQLFFLIGSSEQRVAVSGQGLEDGWQLFVSSRDIGLLEAELHGNFKSLQSLFSRLVHVCAL
jgi:hypothetical protein